MKEKTTSELERILANTHTYEIEKFLSENADVLLDPAKSFAVYMQKMIKKAGLTKQKVFLAADIPEKYGYKLLSEEKHTTQRDCILRICYAARMSLEETQRALKLYGMGELYPKVPRDAVLMVAFNQHNGSILDVNELLAEHGMETLHISGNLD